MSKKELSKSEMASAFYDEIQKHIPTFITVFLCTMGNEMVKTNANKMNTSTEATFEGKRYKVEAKFILKEIKQ